MPKTHGSAAGVYLHGICEFYKIASLKSFKMLKITQVCTDMAGPSVSTLGRWSSRPGLKFPYRTNPCFTKQSDLFIERFPFTLCGDLGLEA